MKWRIKNSLKMGGRTLIATHIEPRFRCHIRSIRSVSLLECMAGTTGLEPATSAVTGQRSNQLSYVPRLFFNNLVIRHIESSVSQFSLFSLFSTISLLWTQFWPFVDTTWTPRWTPNRINATTESSLSDEMDFGVHCCRSQSKSFASRPP